MEVRNNIFQSFCIHLNNVQILVLKKDIALGTKNVAAAQLPCNQNVVINAVMTSVIATVGVAGRQYNHRPALRANSTSTPISIILNHIRRTNFAFLSPE